jgi:hypothetical protein
MATKVEFGFNKDINGNYLYNDISNYVRSISISRGKSTELSSYNAGNCSIALNNHDRAFDPSYPNSPYNGQIVPTGGLRVTVDDEQIFEGFINDWNLTYDLSGDSLAQVTANDAFIQLTNQAMTAHTASVELTGTRINSVLSRAEVDWPLATRDISVGASTLQDDVVSDGTNVLSYLQTVEMSEPGRLYVDRFGNIVFKDKNDALYETTSNFSRTNLSPNPSFESSTATWILGSGSLARATAGGGATIEYTETDITTAGSAYANLAGSAHQNFDAEGNATYTASLYAKASAGTVSLTFIGYQSIAGSAYDLSASTVAVLGTAWSRYDISWRTESDYIYGRVGISTTGGTAQVDAVLIEKNPLKDFYFDGDIKPTDTDTTTYVTDWNT